MRTLDPADVVHNGGHWSIVLRSRRCAAAPERERAGSSDGDDFPAQRSDVRAKILPTLVVVVQLHNVRSIGGDTERIDDVGADQKRMPDVDAIIEVLIAIRIYRKRVLSIVR